MARRKRRVRRHRKNIRPIAIKAISACAVIAFIFLFYCWLNNFFRTSRFFNVSRIELVMKPFLKEALSLDFYRIPRHSNIFQLDIDAIGRRTEKAHPEFKSVILSRKLPDVLYIRIIYKEPVAVVKKNGESAPVSADGVLLPKAIAEGNELPLLKGEKLSHCLKFLQNAQQNWNIEGHRIGVVDATNARNISIFLENGLQIMLGDGSSLKEKFLTLKGILDEPTFDFSKIKYIDMRFSDVVIASRLTKK